MEGEDDHTLDPGETVKLVQDAPADTPFVRIRTTDSTQLEGKIATNYLRRRTSIIDNTMSKSRPLDTPTVEPSAQIMSLDTPIF